MKTEKKTTNSRQDVSRRLKIASGHLHKVIDMVDGGVYCIDVIQQITAVRSAIKKAEDALIVSHLNHCVIDAFRSKDGNRAVKELEQVFKRIR